MSSVTRDLANMWLVSGRCWGDDDDAVEIIEAPWREAAESFFREVLKMNSSKEINGDDIWVHFCQPLEDAVDDRYIIGGPHVL